MKICITSQDDNLDAQVEGRFGRSPYFIIYDTDSSSFEAIKNPNVSAPSGAGIQSGQLIAAKNVDVILTGNQLGPKAAQVIEAAKIKVVTGVSGTVREAIKQYQSGATVTSTEEISSVKGEELLQTEKTVPVGSANNWFRRCTRRWFGRGNGGNYRQNSGKGFGQGMGIQGGGRGQGGRLGQGGRGFGGAPNQCLCPKCGEIVAHQRGVPCRSLTCPKCGTTMVRK